jgi:hypothetical protein
MAVYKIFSSKDATLYSEFSTANTGLDEILEIAGYRDVSGIGRTARAVLQFPDNDIQYVLGTLVTGNYSASLKLYLADATELPVEFNVEAFPISESWDNGKGKFGDVPTDISGVSWEKSTAVTFWNTTGSDFLNISSSSQPFGLNLPVDINLDITNIVNAQFSGQINNYGILLKLEDNYENYNLSSLKLKYFSRDTNTIYPPVLEIKWDDSSYLTGSLPLLETTNPVITFKNNKQVYTSEEKVRFRLSATPKYPARIFTTSSVYLTNHALPENSYWAIKDEYTGETIVDFDNQFTKVSCDNSGPYFDLYTEGLQQERYYRVLIKTTLDGSTTVIDDKNIFKIIKNV